MRNGTKVKQTGTGGYPAWQGDIQDPMMGKTMLQKCCINLQRDRREKNKLNLSSLRYRVEVSPQVRAGWGGGVGRSC